MVESRNPKRVGAGIASIGTGRDAIGAGSEASRAAGKAIEECKAREASEACSRSRTRRGSTRGGRADPCCTCKKAA